MHVCISYWGQQGHMNYFYQFIMDSLCGGNLPQWLAERRQAASEVALFLTGLWTSLQYVGATWLLCPPAALDIIWVTSCLKILNTGVAGRSYDLLFLNES